MSVRLWCLLDSDVDSNASLLDLVDTQPMQAQERLNKLKLPKLFITHVAVLDIQTLLAYRFATHLWLSPGRALQVYRDRQAVLHCTGYLDADIEEPEVDDQESAISSRKKVSKKMMSQGKSMGALPGSKMGHDRSAMSAAVEGSQFFTFNKDRAKQLQETIKYYPPQGDFDDVPSGGVREWKCDVFSAVFTLSDKDLVYEPSHASYPSNYSIMFCRLYTSAIISYWPYYQECTAVFSFQNPDGQITRIS